MERKKARITIKSIQHDIENTATEQTYYGHYAHSGGRHLLSYEETFESDSENAVVRNLYKISDRTLSLSKSGAITTRMLFDTEKKYQNVYRTPLGSFDLLLRTKAVEITSTGKILTVFLNYDLFMNHNFISNCTIEINCKIIEQGR
ncbi:MAG: DUF1934 domain-containing protein [Lachnospiraceae bacterium]|nr:DUF1934 domain-containing protein [Lachnospiraceae bacterium]